MMRRRLPRALTVAFLLLLPLALTGCDRLEARLAKVFRFRSSGPRRVAATREPAAPAVTEPAAPPAAGSPAPPAALRSGTAGSPSTPSTPEGIPPRAGTAPGSSTPVLTEGDLPCTRTSCPVTLVLRHKKVCHSGDLGYLRLDLKRYSKQKRVAFSLEPLDLKPKEQPSFVSVRGGDELLQDGATAPMRVPPSFLGRPLAVLLCKDTSGSGTCLEKPTEDLSRVLASAFHATKGRGTYQIPDHVYYAGLLFLKESGKALTHAGDPSTADEAFTRLASHYPVLDADGVKKPLEAARRKLVPMLRELRNLPVVIAGGGRVELTFAAYDPACGPSEDDKKYAPAPGSKLPRLPPEVQPKQ